MAPVDAAGRRPSPAVPFLHRLGPWRRVGGRSLRFLFMGPPLGGALCALALMLMGLGEAMRQPDGQPAAWLLNALLLGMPVALAFGYVFGALPALLTGAWSGWLSGRARRAWHLWAVGLCGGLSSIAFGWLFGWWPDAPGLLGGSGAAAALLSELGCRGLEARSRPATLGS